MLEGYLHSSNDEDPMSYGGMLWTKQSNNFGQSRAVEADAVF